MASHSPGVSSEEPDSSNGGPIVPQISHRITLEDGLRCIRSGVPRKIALLRSLSIHGQKNRPPEHLAAQHGFTPEAFRPKRTSW